jgi:hypothetical protein
MNATRYCTPEWLESSAEGYRKNPRFQKEFEKLRLKVTFCVKEEPAWGIEKEIYFLSEVDKGDLKRLAFVSEAEAARESDYILAATPQEWKKILRKESKFIGDFMLGKITLQQGSKVGVLSVAPHSNTFVEALTQFELQFPDEMSPEELECFRAYVQEFRAALSV